MKKSRVAAAAAADGDRTMFESSTDGDFPFSDDCQEGGQFFFLVSPLPSGVHQAGLTAQARPNVP